MSKFIGVINRNSAHLSFFLLFAVVFLLGDTFGAVLATLAEKPELDSFALNMTYSAEHLVDNRWGTVIRSVISVWTTLIALWICGFMPRIPSVVLSGSIMVFKGVTIGYTLGMMFRIYGGKGVALAVASVLPQYIILLPLMFLTASMAANAFKGISVKSAVKGYMVFAVFFLMIGLVGALADVLVTPWLIGFIL